VAANEPSRAGAQTTLPSPLEGARQAVEVIGFRGISKTFPTNDGHASEVIAGIDLSVCEGEFVAVVGPSGCGKSTLLNMAAGVMSPTDGTVSYRGEQVGEANTRVGYVTQRDDLLPWRTVIDNVALPLELRRLPRRERVDRARAMLEKVGLTGFEDHYPSQISGGMRKRVNMARTLVYEPETLLLDEPFGALDAQLRLLLQQDLLDLLQESSKTVVLVTHDLAEAVVLSDRVVVLGTKPGRLLAVEDIDLPRPRSVDRERFSAETGEMQQRLWRYLENEVKKGVDV